MGDPSAKHKFLRKELQYEYYWYYIAMVVDPILRFNWIFYVIFAFEVQHASLNSFCIALAEVLRRGMWTMIRIENEHCTNVRFARATMNPSMPFAEAQPEQQQEDRPRTQSGVDVLPEGDILHTDSREESRERDGDEGRSTGAERFREGVRKVQSHQQKQKESPAAQTFKRVGHIMAAAHAYDYERKKPPGSVKGDGADEDDDDDVDDDDDDDEVGR